MIDSPETIKALEYAKELYATFVPGTLSWLDPNNNKAFLDGQISLTNNGISIYYAAKNSQDPKVKEMAADIYHANMPIGPVGRPTEFQLFFNQMIFKYTKYPKAAKEFLRFMMEPEQIDPWLQAGIGYVTPPLRYYEKNPIWTVGSRSTRRIATAMKNMLPIGLCRQDGLRVGRGARRLHRRQHGGRGGVAARRRRRKRRNARRSGRSATTRYDVAPVRSGVDVAGAASTARVDARALDAPAPRTSLHLPASRG